jgi:short-subunit dehydrogenase
MEQRLMREFGGTTALVTGASSGIGAALARRLADCGCNLILTARRQARLEALRDEILARHGRLDVQVVAADLARADGPSVLHEEVSRRGLRVDVLVNNAGFGVYGLFAASAAERQREMLQVNLLALVELTRRFLPAMIERREGYILQVASIAAYVASPFLALYGGSKAFVLRFSQALAHELRATGVHVTTLAPGGTATEFMDVSGQGLSDVGRRGVMPADAVAAAGLRALARRRYAVVPGLLYKVMTWMLRLVPDALAIRAAALFTRLGAARPPS